MTLTDSRVPHPFAIFSAKGWDSETLNSGAFLILAPRSFSLPRTRAGNKRRHPIMQLLQALVAHINHVPRLIPVIFDILCQRLRNRQMLFLVLRGKEWRSQIVVAAVHHYFQSRIGLHRLSQIWSHVHARRIATMLEVPLRDPELSFRQIGLSLPILQIAPHVVVK